MRQILTFTKPNLKHRPIRHLIVIVAIDLVPLTALSGLRHFEVNVPVRYT